MPFFRREAERFERPLPRKLLQLIGELIAAVVAAYLFVKDEPSASITSFEAMFSEGMSPKDSRSRRPSSFINFSTVLSFMV